MLLSLHKNHAGPLYDTLLISKESLKHAHTYTHKEFIDMCFVSGMLFCLYFKTWN